MVTKVHTIQLVRQIKAELDRVLDGPSRLAGKEPQPRADIVQSESHICLLVEVPGLSAEDIKVAVEGRLVTIAGEKRRPSPPSDGAQFLLVERQWGRFERHLELPSTAVNPREAKATLANGLLCIEFPLITDNRDRRYELTVQTGQGEQQ